MIISKFIIPLLSLGIGGWIIGKSALKNGWIEGLKLGIIIIILILIGNLIFKQPIVLKDWIFYFVLVTSSMLGSMLGINMKKN